MRVFSETAAGRDVLRASEILTARGNQRFQPLPPPTGPAPYRLKLADVLPPDRMKAIQQAGKLVFHAGGDTGGVKRPEAQRIVADHMARQMDVSPGDRPAFFYHLGDVVYFYGEAREYFPQFYDPYENYDAPIFAIPGNHDGDLPNGSAVRSLDAFVRNFCSPTPRVSPDAGEITRHAMTQPNCYWTLDAPWARIIGLYTNVPEGGAVTEEQATWLTKELAAAPKNGALIVALHHPPFSLDAHHSGSLAMTRVLDRAFEASGRTPHLVLSGHVHNYQRFTRRLGSRHVPYVVAGASGYWHLHAMKRIGGQPLPVPYPVSGDDVTLERHVDDRHGFLRLTVSAAAITGEYFTVPRPQESWRAPARRVDSFRVRL